LANSTHDDVTNALTQNTGNWSHSDTTSHHHRTASAKT